MATAEDIGALKSQMSELTDALGRIESMALQASMNASKQHKAVAEAIERIEGMCMAQSTSIAKFEKKSGESQQTMEGMLMQAAMNSAKWQKAMDDRQQTMEGMLMQASMTAAKQQAAINKLAEDAGEEEGVPPEDDSDESDEDDPLELDEATLEKLKAATYEKLAKAKGQTIEELKATVKAATDEERVAYKKELNVLASKTVARAQIRRKAQQELAASKGFDSLEKLEAHIKGCGEEEKAALLVEMNEIVAKALAAAEEGPKRTGRSMWKKAKLMIPFASAVKTLADIPLAVAERVAAEDVDPSMPKVVIGDSSCIPIQVAVPVEQ